MDPISPGPHGANESALARLATQLATMPPVRAMALEPLDFDGLRLRMHAPLAANVNDKGCAFGGSLAGAMTLAAWGLIGLKLDQAGLAAEVYIADSQIRYRAPLYADLLVVSGPDSPQSGDYPDWPGFIAELRAAGKARINLSARTVLPDGGVVAELDGRFAAVLPRSLDAADKPRADG